tara:strand:+ start:1683 stop:2087 length:405 start_codon:yes stop_codon:yes gene_type:complete
MKLTQKQLKRIIKEELEEVLRGSYHEYYRIPGMIDSYKAAKTKEDEGYDELLDSERGLRFMDGFLEDYLEKNPSATKSPEALAMAIEAGIAEYYSEDDPGEDDPGEYEIIDPADNIQGMISGDPMSGVGGYGGL